MKAGWAASLAVALLLALTASATVATAFDQKISYNFDLSPTANDQALQLAVNQLANQTTSSNPQLSSLASRFSSSLNTGNATAERSALSQLEAYPQLGTTAPALQDLLKSLSVNGDGSISVNPGLLGSLLGANSPNSQGVPSGLQGVGSQLATENMNSMISLLNGLTASNPALVGDLLGQLLNDQNQMSLGLPNGSFGSIPKIQGGPGSLPGFGASPLGGPSVGSVGSVSPSQVSDVLAASIALAVAAAFLLVTRKRVMALLRGQTLPGARTVLETDEVGLEPTPRNRVLLAFNRMLKAMSSKGTVRERHETHREFSRRCAPLPEGEPVNSVSGYYEKAKFSASEVTEQDAAKAEQEASAVESPRPVAR